MPETTGSGLERRLQLKRILEDERKRILGAVRLTIREGREEGAMEDAEVQDEAERSQADVQSDLEFALLQMHGETLDRITEALERLDAGRYGYCVDCRGGIPARRLHALPFATRCMRCERKRETKDASHPAHRSWKDAVHLIDMRA